VIEMLKQIDIKELVKNSDGLAYKWAKIGKPVYTDEWGTDTLFSSELKRLVEDDRLTIFP
jgi:hypothetical protein